ncbi:MAG: flagellar hook-associated protein 3 [Actinobacteria bacterium]|nr:MAG: flagellar hook-associated protein 3 [Actinomycetota bacterium]
MLGRVTNNTMARTLLGDITSLTSRIARTQESISSGRQLTAPSDDPLGTQRSLGLRSAVEGAQQHQRNIDEATGWLETTDDALSDAASVINRARELTVQGASDSLGPDQRQAIALEIDQLIEAVKESANATFQGTYVFSGAATTTAPYAAGSNVFGADPSGTVARTIGPGVSVKINTNANDIFGSGAPAAPDGKLISTLQSISAHLKTDTPAAHDALRNGDLADLSANLDTLSQARATVGAVMSRLDSAKNRLADVELTTTKLLSETEDTDLAKAVLDLTNQQNVYQAALRSGASIIQPSLLDFLR